MPDIDIALRKIERALFVLMTHSLCFYGGIWIAAKAMGAH